MKVYKGIFIGTFFAGALSFSFLNYVSSVKERNVLLGSIYQKEEQFNQLKKEQQGLLRQLANLKEAREGLKDYLKVSRRKINRLFIDLDYAKKASEELNSRYNIVKAENTALKQRRQALNQELLQAREENSALRQRFSSLAELRLAIRQLKKHLYAQAGIQPALRPNGGYLIKDGKTTYSTAVKIEVTAASQ